MVDCHLFPCCADVLEIDRYIYIYIYMYREREREREEREREGRERKRYVQRFG